MYGGHFLSNHDCFYRRIACINCSIISKLHVSDSISRRNRSLIKMLKIKGPRKEPCGITIEICLAELHVDPILTLCILFSRSYKVILVLSCETRKSRSVLKVGRKIYNQIPLINP